VALASKVKGELAQHRSVIDHQAQTGGEERAAIHSRRHAAPPTAIYCSMCRATLSYASPAEYTVLPVV